VASLPRTGIIYRSLDEGRSDAPESYYYYYYDHQHNHYHENCPPYHHLQQQHNCHWLALASSTILTHQRAPTPKYVTNITEISSLKFSKKINILITEAFFRNTHTLIKVVGLEYATL
jgi:hypothetical protein